MIHLEVLETVTIGKYFFEEVPQRWHVSQTLFGAVGGSSFCPFLFVH